MFPIIYFLFFSQPLIQMYNGISNKTIAIAITTLNEIEVHSSILSANAESKIPNEVKAIGRSEDCHLAILRCYFKDYNL